ncbi:MAG: ArnT family glycosyltransferase [Kiritimatiellia bacterium]
MNTRNILLLVAGLMVVRMLFMSILPVFEPSEARYAAISANMDRSDDFRVPRFTYKDRYQSFDGKPPLQFQLSGLSCRLLGRSAFAVRLPILLATLGMLALLWKTLCVLAGRERAALGVGIGATCTAYYALAGCCMPDGLLTPCVASAYCCHILYLKTERRIWTLGVFAALALGMLVKGPVAIALFTGPVLLDAGFNHRWRLMARYAWWSGIPLFLAIATPWFVLMTRENPDFLKYFFLNENVKRFLVRDYGDRYGSGHEFFRGMAAVWAVVVTLPWMPLGVRAWWRKASRIAACDRCEKFDRCEGFEREGVLKWLGLTERRDVAGVFAWGIAGITAFWCLTSRIPMAYLMPIVPLFAAWLALKGEVRVLRRALPYAAAISLAVLSAAMLGLSASDKVPGAAATYRRNRYSYEFYHGTPAWAKEARRCNP